MPATRSRTENWRQSLQQIYERNGALEISLPRYFEAGNQDGAPGDPRYSAEGAADLIWRVRILGIDDAEILVEEPAALGHTFSFETGIELVGIICIGQNRWMFRTRNLGSASVFLAGGRSQRVMRLRMPAGVERCQRRSFYRVSTIGLHLPRVECYPLLDPASVLVAETANRIQILDLFESPVAGTIGKPPEPVLMPQVGPSFEATLMNLGGGGAGLMVEPAHRGALSGEGLFWLRICLKPHVPAPLAVTARLKHTHIDSTQRTYAGLAFEFGYNPQHQKFVVEQLCRYVALVQREQLKRHQPI